MYRVFSPALLVPAILMAAAGPAHAELVFLSNGRTLSVRSIEEDGNLLVLRLREGGEVICGRDLIARVEPDEGEVDMERKSVARASWNFSNCWSSWGFSCVSL